MAEVKSDRVVIGTGDQYKPSIVIDAPGNSFKDKGTVPGKVPTISNGVPSPTQERRSIKAVATATSKPHKEGKMRKAFSWLVGEDVQDVKGYMIDNVILPTLRRTILDIGAALLGEPIGRNYGGYGSGSIGRRATTYSYQRFWDNRDTAAGRNANRQTIRETTPYPFDDVYVQTNADAQEILNELQDLINEYGNARMSDFYAAAGLQPRITDEEWGWYDLVGATYRQTRDGVLMVMPRAVSLRR